MTHPDAAREAEPTSIRPTTPTGPTTAPSSRRRQLDAVWFLTVFLVLLFAIRSDLIIGSLRGAGSPALLMGLLALAWWLYHQVSRREPTGMGVQPVRWALLAFVAAFVASFAVAMRRPIDPDEVSIANLGLVQVFSLTGVTLLALDGLNSPERWRTLSGRLVAAAGLLALLGLAQFATGSLLLAGWSIPGLTPNSGQGAAELVTRNGFVRPSGTAIHPLEFAATLCTMLPLALTRARFASVRGDHRQWVWVALLGLGLVVSLSRSAIICAFVAIVLLVARWRLRELRWLAVGVAVMMVAVAVTVPSLLGSIRGLFVSAPGDNSIASRTGSYGIAFQFFRHWPIFGRGYSTFLPKHRIFDNQYLDMLDEVGVVGVLSFLLLLAVAAWAALRARRLAVDAEERETGQSLFAGLMAAGVGLAFFDGFSFPLSTYTLVLMVGLCGSYYRLFQPPATNGARPPVDRP